LPPGGSNNNALAERRRGLPGFLDAWTSGLAGAAGERAPVVAVLDTGVTPHPDLQGRVLPGHDFVSADLFSADGQGGRDADPSDPGDGVDAADLADPRFAGCSIGASSWHGTSVAGLLAAIADNAYGGAGILRAGRVLPVRVAGKCGATVADIVDGMRWAAGLSVAGVPDNPNPARIVNISFGGSLDCGREYQDTIDELHDAGVLVVAAAGNDHGKVSRPASCRGVVGVVALNRDGFKTHYSNFGSVLADTGIATVGGDDDEGAWGPLLADGGIVALTNSGVAGPVSPDHAAHAGTSFAAPMAAGTLALMLSVNPALGAEQLLAGLRASARPHPGSTLIGRCSDVNPGRCVCTRQTCGVGVLDARQAITYAAAPDSYVGPRWPVEDLGGTEVARAVALGADRPPAGASDGGGGGSGGSGADESAGGGGGALGLPWLLGLALVLPTLRRARQRRSR
jgi:serine protease